MSEHWLFIGLVAGILTLILSYFLDTICTALKIHLPEQISERELKNKWKTIKEYIIIYPLAEEIVFRFAAIESVRVFTDSYIYLSIVVFVSSIIFGLGHGSLGNILVQGVAGIVYSVAYCLGGFPASLTAHMFDNGVIILYLYFFPDSETEGPTPLYPS